MCSFGNASGKLSRKAAERGHFKGGDWSPEAKRKRRPIQLAGTGAVPDQPPMAAVNVFVAGRFRLIHVPAPRGAH